MTSAIAALGTTLTWNSQAVAEISEIGGLKISVKFKDVTNLSSTSGFEEQIPTLLKAEPISIKGNFISSDTNGQQAMISDMRSKTSRTAVITFPTAITATWTATCYIGDFDIGPMKADGSVEFSCTLTPTGVPTLAITASTGLTSTFFAISESAVIVPAPAQAVYTYVATVATGITSVTVTPIATAGVITVNGSTVTTGQASSAIALGAAGSITTITVVVTETGKVPKTYTIYLTRASA